MTHKSDTENSKGNNKTPSRRQFLQYAGLAAGGGTLLAATPKLWSEAVSYTHLTLPTTPYV